MFPIQLPVADATVRMTPADFLAGVDLTTLALTGALALVVFLAAMVGILLSRLRSLASPGAPPKVVAIPHLAFEEIEQSTDEAA